MRIVSACSIFIMRAVSTFIIRAGETWALLDVDPVGRGLKGLLKANVRTMTQGSKFDWEKK